MAKGERKGEGVPPPCDEGVFSPPCDDEGGSGQKNKNKELINKN